MLCWATLLHLKSHATRPHATGLVNRLPLWLAPNLITLIASACIAVAYAINIVYLPNFSGQCCGRIIIMESGPRLLIVLLPA